MPKQGIAFRNNYPAAIIALFLLAVSFDSFSQIHQPPSLWGKRESRHATDSAWQGPTGSGVPTSSNITSRKQFGLYFDSTNKKMYYYNPKLAAWDTLQIGVGGSGSSIVVSDSAWSKTGNSGTDTSVNWIGTNDAKDLRINTNGTRRFTVNANGALGIGAAPDYGTSGYLLKSLGSGSAPAWVAASSVGLITASNGLTASAGDVKLGGNLTQNTTINNGTYDFTWNTASDPSDFDITGESSILLDSRNSGISAQVGLSSGYSVTLGTYTTAAATYNSALEIYRDSIGFSPWQGHIAIDSLANRSNQNTLVGWINGISAPSGNGHGNLGYITIGPGISLSGGTLSGSQDLASVTSYGNTTPTDIQFDDGGTDYTIIGTTSGTGYFKFRSSTNSNNAIIANNPLTADRTYNLPDASGTVSLISNPETLQNKNIQLTIVTKTASDTLELTDAGKDIEMNVSSGNSLSVPANADVAFPVGTQIIITQLGAGQTTIVALSGVTIRSSGGKLKITDQYSGATLIKRGTNEWVLYGNLSL